LVLVNSLILVVAAAAGKFAQGGVKLAGAGKAGVVATFLAFIVGPTAILATIVFLIERVKSEKYLFGGITLFCWVLLVTQGRRELVYPALVTITLARYAGFRWNQLSFGRILLIGIGLGFLFVGVLTYQLLRLAGGAVGSSTHSISAEANKAQQWVDQGRAWEIAVKSSTQNVQRRTLEVTFLSSLLYMTKTERPAYGKDLVLQIETVIPSLLYKDKPTMVEEDLASETFGVHYPDQPNSVFTAGALDFGIFGVMLYGVGTIMLLSLFFRLGVTYFSYEVSFFGLASFVITSIAAEQQLNGYFGSMRNWLIFAMFIYGVSKLPQFNMGSIDRRGYRA
jgi:hypothetical protein